MSFFSGLPGAVVDLHFIKKGEFLNDQPAEIPTQENQVEAETVHKGRYESLVHTH